MAGDVCSSPTAVDVNKSRYRPEIDGLRAFAVVAVIINHFNKDILPGGYLGVDIFFVISGYVITSSLLGRHSDGFGDFILGFYERRVRRLVPALAVFVLLMSVSISLLNPRPGFSLVTGISSLFGLSNLYLFSQSADYFSQDTALNIFAHTWSLGVEEQFYAMFPFLIWFSGFSRQAVSGARNLFLVVGLLAAVSLVGFLHAYPSSQSAAYFLMPFRFWEMASGCLIFLVFYKRVSIERLLEKVPPLLVIFLIVAVMYLPMSMASLATVTVVALSSVLIASLKKETAAFKFFTNPRVVYLGLISYSLYLWHWGVLSISRWTIGIHWWSVPFQAALMLGLAIASYRWLEVPLRRGSWFGSRWKTLLMGGSVLIVLSGGLAALGKPLKGILFASNFSAKDFEYVQAAMPCELQGRNPSSRPLSCLQSRPNATNIYVFGDSHASNLVPALLFAASSNGYEDVKYLTNASAEKMQGKAWYENESVHAKMIKVSKDDLLVWSATQTIDKSSAAAQIEYLINLSAITQAPLLIVDDIVSFGGDNKFYPKFAFYGKGPVVPFDEALSARASFANLLRAYAPSGERVYYFDPLPVLCPRSACSAVINEQLIYADGSPHFTKAGASLLSESLARKIKKIRSRRIE